MCREAGLPSMQYFPPMMSLGYFAIPALFALQDVQTIHLGLALWQ